MCYLYSTDTCGRFIVPNLRFKTAKEVYHYFKTRKFKYIQKKKGEAQEKAAMQENKFKIQARQKEEKKTKTDNYFNTQIRRER